MSFIKEFKAFIVKGNVVDLAIAVIIGAAFGAIVSSLVDNVITPLLLAPALNAMHVGNIADLKWGAVKYGSFLSAIIKFLVIALVLFSLIKAMNAMKKKEDAVAPGPSTTDRLLMEIRDQLKNRN